MNKKPSRNQLRFIAGLQRAFPLLLPLLAFGISFGLYARQVGFDSSAAMAMSMITFAGGAQFAALGALAAGSGLIAALLAVLLINSRYLSMGLTLANSLPASRWKQFLAGQLLVDETWLLSRRKNGRHRFEFFLAVGIAEWLIWALGTLLGLAFAEHLPAPETLGLDMAIAAFFLALMAGQLDHPDKRAAAIGSAALALLLLPLAQPGLALLLAPLPALIWLSLRRNNGGNRQTPPQRNLPAQQTAAAQAIKQQE
ncbi:branched-chain amino acid permease [Permianibacter sp. IMCC34836]|uniref:AzlC family ABC transporter permease n=1 Tax=Permianibacter fluminis TaxID=2738515 RepID=UPI001552380A|nr:AzlC family ABC transporter permease [Permianibacter fluminis]NQD38107.1 branched-chain amino acid permease [Permianibacter fluminis]